MSETIGELIDKLCITELKLWHVQEQVYRYQRMSLEEYALVSAAETKRTWDRLAQLNLDRSRLITETDVAINEAIRTGQARVDPRVKLTE